ncbi:hypothetical protein JIP62_01610 [Brevundimonas vitis]|uniref:Rap1a immunity protein domain-containing protein n=1 Tax=Brevundimonas vitisensis TaxID=2800818 RepID=A0ABX7BQ84_9CAUL|nr:hypothetical protein [Brevundimonas vitisensis]QQQ18868.1 hypothetical protein JIP62_01610 [Brevundimonas vitisensis]
MTRLFIAALAPFALAAAPMTAAAMPVSTAVVAPAVAQDEAAEQVFNFLALCMAADIVETQQGVESTPEREVGTEKIFDLLMLAGQNTGRTEDQMAEVVAGYAAAWLADASLLQSSPPASVRQQCLDTIDAA